MGASPHREWTRRRAAVDRSLDWGTTVRAILDGLVPAAADWAMIALREGGGALRTVAARHADPNQQPLLDRFLGTTEASRVPRSVRWVLRHGQPRRETAPVRILPDGLAEADYRELGKKLATCDSLLAPLQVNGDVLGVLRLGMSTSGRRYGAGSIAGVGEIARHAGLALDRARSYLQAKEEAVARDDLLAMVAHDLRNYLTTIQLSAQLLQRRPGPREPERITRTVRRMSELLHSLGDATMMERGQFRVDPGPVRPQELLETTRTLFAPRAEAKEIRLAVDHGDLPPTLRCDRERILQVLANLTDNAVKFTPREGTVHLSARTVSDGVRFEVRDSGPGIPAALRPELFERHRRTLRDNHRGSGLGLFIAKGIVEAHRGRISVANAPGGGTVFGFTLPARPRKAPARPAASARP